MEGSVGKALRDARLKQNLTIEEVARVTKMRPARIADLENDDYMHFPNLAYARSFLVLYAKFLRVDITKYPTVEVGSSVGLGDYQYLRSDEAEKASSPRTEPSGPPEKPRWLIAFFVFILMALVGALIGLAVMQFMRLGSVENLVKKDVGVYNAPAASPTATPVSTPSATPSVTPGSVSDAKGSEMIVAAIPVLPSANVDAAIPVLPAEPVSSAVAAVPTPEVRRAEAVISGSSDADILAEAAAAAAATPEVVPEETPSVFPPKGAVREIKVRVTKKTRVRIVRDNESSSLYSGNMNPAMAPLSFKGKYFWIKTNDPDAVKVTINDQPVTGPEAGVEIQ